jgi:hypothetical protein
VERELVDQPGRDELLAGLGAAHDRDVLVAGRGTRLLEC